MMILTSGVGGLQTKVTGFNSLVHRQRIVARIELGCSYGSPYSLRYIKNPFAPSRES